MPRLLDSSLDLAVNLIASVIFWLGLGLIVRATTLKKSHRKFVAFFGLEKWPMTVYLSNLWDSKAKPAVPGCIVAGQEFRIPETVTNLFGRASARLPEIVRGLVDSYWLKDKIKFSIRVSPYPDYHEVSPPESMIVVGTSTKNSVRRRYIQDDVPLLEIKGEPRALLKDSRKERPLEDKIIATRGNVRTRQIAPPPEIDAGSYPAIIERLYRGPDKPVVFMCIGYNGYCSWAAVEYLCQNWDRLADKHKEKSFALCLWFPGIESNDTTPYVEPKTYEVDV